MIPSGFFSDSRLTNFALTTLVPAHEHATVTVWHETAAKETRAEALTRLHRLHG